MKRPDPVVVMINKPGVFQLSPALISAIVDQIEIQARANLALKKQQKEAEKKDKKCIQAV